MTNQRHSLVYVSHKNNETTYTDQHGNPLPNHHYDPYADYIERVERTWVQAIKDAMRLRHD